MPPTSPTPPAADYIEESSGRFEDARALSELALAVTEKEFGTVHKLTASRLNNLGSLLTRMDELGNARTILEHSLQVYEQLFGKEHTELARPYANLGSALYLQGEEQKGSDLLRKAIDLAPPEDEFYTVMLSNWAACLVDKGDLEEPIFHRTARATHGAHAGCWPGQVGSDRRAL
jgi:tetratricopeptide (TPR) repeat protein